MPGALFPGESDWLNQLSLEDRLNNYVISDNYRFEFHHEILSESIRDKYNRAQRDVEREIAPLTPSALQLYFNAIIRDRVFWTAGSHVSLEQPLMMIKDGRTIYREQWSFLSGLPREPDSSKIELALESGTGAGGDDSPEHLSLRRGAAVDYSLSQGLQDARIREQINQDLADCHIGELRPDEAKTWDSYAAYQNSMVKGGYIPIWWVTTQADLQRELSGANNEEALAEVAIEALGLSKADPGVYYAVELPDGGSDAHNICKPTILSGGIPFNQCAVLTHMDPGKTVRLGTGEAGLPEAVMCPLDPSSAWPGLRRLGAMAGLPRASNVVRIKERLAVQIDDISSNGIGE